MLNKILFAVDIRETDKSAFNEALSLAKITGAKLMLLNIIAPDNTKSPNPFIYSGYEYDLMAKPCLSPYTYLSGILTTTELINLYLWLIKACVVCWAIFSLICP